MIMALTKADLAQKLIDKQGVNKRVAKEFVEKYFEQIVEGLLSLGEVKLSGFGNFNTRDKPKRPGRNPKTGEPVEISARRVVTFHAGQKLRARVEAYNGTPGSQTEAK